MSLFSRMEGDASRIDGLRYYQEEAIAAILQAWGRDSSFRVLDVIPGGAAMERSQLLVMATGLGKTETFGAMATGWPGKVLVLAHRDELVDQARKRLERMSGEWCEIEQADFRAALTTRIVIASVQTLAQDHRLHRFPPEHFSLVIVDEAHHYIARTFKKPLEYFARAMVLGVTATPDRGDGKAMAQQFGNVPFQMDIEDGIEAGYLVPVVGRRVHLDEINLEKVKASKGDLQEGQLDEAMSEAVEGIVRKTLELEPGRRGIAFFPGVATAELAAATFNRMRPDSAIMISGATDPDERKRLVAAFKRGDHQYLCNCQIATEGFDSPGVSLIIQGRPTKSRSLYAQMVGRGTRVLPKSVDHIPGRDGAEGRREAIAASAKPDMVILDFVGNSGRHTLCTVEDVLGGRYTDEEKERAKKKTGNEKVNTRQALEESRRELAAMAKAIKDAKVKSRVNNFNPFSLVGMDDDSEKYNQKYGFKPLKDNMRKSLEKAGYKPEELAGVSSRDGGKLLAEHYRRMNGGLATVNQLRQLQRYGVTETNITKARASAGMEYIINQTNWGKRALDLGPFGQVKGRVDPRKLSRILGSREPGEEG